MSADPRAVAVMVRLTVSEAAALDAARGDTPRAEWVRRLTTSTTGAP